MPKTAYIGVDIIMIYKYLIPNQNLLYIENIITQTR